MDTKTITAQTKKAVAIGLCASLIGGVAAPVLSTANAAYAASVAKPQPNQQHSSIIKFKDENLKNAILSDMKKQDLIDEDAKDITENDAFRVRALSLNSSSITSLEGLEALKNLTSLNLNDNHISDLKPLAGLAELKELSLNNIHLSDLTPLASLTNLETLFFCGNHLSDLKPLAGLSNINFLKLGGNQISDLSPLAGLGNLTELHLTYNQVSDLTPLAGLSKLTKFYAYEQTITLHPKSSKVDLKKEIKGAGNVVFDSDKNIVDGVLTHKDGMKNPYVVKTKDGEKYSATINIDFSNAPKSSETQTGDISEKLQALLNEYDAVKGTDNYKNADDKLKQAYDKAIKDGQKIYDKLSSTPAQVKQAAETIKTALEALNGDKKAQATIQSLQQQLNTATGNVQKLTSELEKAKQQGTADASTIATLTGKVSDLTQQLEKLKSDKTLSEQQKQAKIDELNGKIAELGKQITQLTQENTTLKGQGASLQEQLGKLQAQLQSAQQQGVADKATIERLTGQVTSLSSQLEALKTDKTKSEQEKQREIEQLTKDKEGLQEQINTKQAEISKLQGQIQTLKDDHTKSDTEKQQEIERLTNQLATLTQEKQDLQGKLDAANEKVSTLTQQLQQAASKVDAHAKQIRELTDALQQAKQQLEQLKSDKTKSNEQKQKEIEQLNTKIAELEKKVQTCRGQAVGGAIVAPLVNEKPTFDIEKYKREHNYMLPGSASYTYQAKPDTFTSDVHAALQQLAPMAASTDAPGQATAQRTDESECAQAEQKANTSSKQDADKAKLDQSKFPQTGDNSLLTLLSTFAGALVLVLGCFARKKQSCNINKK